MKQFIEGLFKALLFVMVATLGVGFFLIGATLTGVISLIIMLSGVLMLTGLVVWEIHFDE